VKHVLHIVILYLNITPRIMSTFYANINKRANATDIRDLATDKQANATDICALTTDKQANATDIRNLTTDMRALTTDNRADATDIRTLTTDIPYLRGQNAFIPINQVS